jgi:hypothetical protein
MNKGFVKNTPAKKQFTPVWNWAVQNRAKFDRIMDLGPYSVYGEWMVGMHGIRYNRLPDWFIAYDVYDYEKHHFLGRNIARSMLTEYGFSVPPVLSTASFKNPEEIHPLTESCCLWASDQRVEGIYIRIGDDTITHRFKMVRSDFARGLPEFGGDGKLIKNQLA